MSRKKYSQEQKLKLVKIHNEQGVSFYKLGKQYNIEPSINIISIDYFISRNRL